jgi:hypothetical protein
MPTACRPGGACSDGRAWPVGQQLRALGSRSGWRSSIPGVRQQPPRPLGDAGGAKRRGGGQHRPQPLRPASMLPGH